MLSFFAVVVSAVVGFWKALGDKEYRALMVIITITISLGTIFYMRVEKWGVIDSFYFCIITLTTVGYGDLYPTTELSKVFTAAYVVVGIGIMATFASLVAKRIVARRMQRHPDDVADMQGTPMLSDSQQKDDPPQT